MSNFQNIGCLIKTPKKTAPKQFFKGVAHEQHWSSIVCLLWWSSIASSFFKVFFQNPFILSCSFPLVVISYFLISILLDFSKCLISQNIGFFIKITPLKSSTHTIFQGGSPWATLIFNSMFVVGVLYCVKFFFEVIVFSKIIFSFPLL